MVEKTQQEKTEEKKTRRKATKPATASASDAPAPTAQAAAPAVKKEEAKKPTLTAAPTTATHAAPVAPAPAHATAPAAHALATPTTAPVAAPAKKRKSPVKKGPATKAVVARGKRKESVARAAIVKGKGVVRFNTQNVNALQNKFIRSVILEPLRYMGPEVNEVDISVTVVGGGMMGQAQAARTAIANALVQYFDQATDLRAKFIGIDRSLVIEDTRRVESKKFRGPKARARYQKSYR